MWENAYLSIKNPSHRKLTSLEQLCSALSATFGLRSWAPLDQILDPHLVVLLEHIQRACMINLSILFVLHIHLVMIIKASCEVQIVFPKIRFPAFRNDEGLGNFDRSKFS